MPASLHLWRKTATPGIAVRRRRPIADRTHDQFYGDRMSGVRDRPATAGYAHRGRSAEELKRRQDEIIEKQQAG